MKRTSWVAMALVSAVLAAGSAGAQVGSTQVRSGMRGPVLGLDFNGTAIGIAGGGYGTPRGAGFGLSLGYGVSERVSVFARTDVAYRLGHLDVGARYSFGSTAARVRPYLEGAFTRMATSAGPLDDPLARSHGYGVTGGAGVEYFVSRRVALDVGLSHSRGQFTSGVLKDRDFGSTRLNVGVKWHP